MRWMGPITTPCWHCTSHPQRSGKPCEWRSSSGSWWPPTPGWCHQGEPAGQPSAAPPSCYCQGSQSHIGQLVGSWGNDHEYFRRAVVNPFCVALCWEFGLILGVFGWFWEVDPSVDDRVVKVGKAPHVISSITTMSTHRTTESESLRLEGTGLV